MDRRSFIRYASFAGAGHFAGLRPFGGEAALAQTSGGYKALVCIFLFGGNDSNNVLIPVDGPGQGYQQYAAVRGPLAIPEAALLPLDFTEYEYGLHPSLPGIQALFNSGYAALVANVGTLVQPLTPGRYKAGEVAAPIGLFEPFHQQQEWQNATSSDASRTGWGGRISDVMTLQFNPNGIIPMVTSVAGDTVFCDGLQTSPLVLDPSNLPTGGSVDKYRPETPLQTQFPAHNELAAQLKVIAEIIQVRESLGMTRQIFFAAMKGFGTYSNQLATQAKLLAQLDAALGSFYQATEEMGIADHVTSFTMSEYSRAFQPNASGGTDPAWGGHPIVIGGAVDGGKIYGAYPELTLGGPNDAGVDGRWIPTTAMSQYGATLASWFGVPEAHINTTFPLVSNFETSNLGFV